MNSSKLVKSKETLLDIFLTEKLQTYIEPTRKGTPKGDPVGFSATKYTATLACMKKMPLKKIAAQLNVSYGLLRKWRTEDKFNELIIQHCTEFAKKVKNHLVRRTKKQDELWTEYIKLPLDEIAKTPPPSLSQNEFMDIRSYSNLLILEMHKTILGYWEKIAQGDELLTMKAGEVIPLVHNLHKQIVYLYDILVIPVSNKKEHERQISKLKRYENGDKEKWLEAIRNILLTKEPDENDRKVAMALTYYIQNKLILVDMDISDFC